MFLIPLLNLKLLDINKPDINKKYMPSHNQMPGDTQVSPVNSLLTEAEKPVQSINA